MTIGNLRSSWKGDNAGIGAKNKRARAWFKMRDQCDICGKKAVDRHHADGDAGNNIPSNIMFLCRKCHMEIDNRLAKLHQNRQNRQNRQTKPPVNCHNCGKPSKPLRKGLCHSCNEYYRRNGKNRPNFIQGSRLVTEGELKLIFALREQGFSNRSIAKVLPISATAIRNVCLLSIYESCHEKEHDNGINTEAVK